MSSRIFPLMALAALIVTPVAAAQGFLDATIEDTWTTTIEPWFMPPPPVAPAEPESPPQSAPEEESATQDERARSDQERPASGPLAPLAPVTAAVVEIAPVEALPLPLALPLPEQLPLSQPGAAPEPASAPEPAVAEAEPVVVVLGSDEPAPAEVAVAVVAMTASAGAAATGTWSWTRLRRFALAAALYTRLAKERLLDHSTRERLLAAIRQQPGRAVADLAETTEIPRNTVTYHLRVLERERLVASQRNGRARLFFAPGTNEARGQGDAIAALRHETSRAMAFEIGQTPGVDQKALCERMGLSPSLAHWHADRLVASGLVDKRREGRFVKYYPGAAFSLVRAC